MRRMPIRFLPFPLAREQSRRAGETLVVEQALESGEPMIVIPRAVVGLALPGRCGELGAERLAPFHPAEHPGLGELYGKREGVRLPGLGKNGFLLAHRFKPGRGSRPTGRYRPRRAWPLP